MEIVVRMGELFSKEKRFMGKDIRCRERAVVKRNRNGLVLMGLLVAAVSSLGSDFAEASHGEAVHHSIARFPIRRGPLVLERPAQARSHLETLGEQAGLWGEAGGHVEGWVYPFKLFHGLTLLFSHDGGKTFRPSSELVRFQVAAPHMAQLRLACDPFAVTQTFFAPRKLPGLAILLDIDTSLDLEIAMRFCPSLAPMLMSVEEKPAVHWDKESRELVAFERQRGVKLLVTSPLASSYLPLADGEVELRLSVPAAESKAGYIPIVFGLSWPKGPSAVSTIRTLLDRLEGLFCEASDHYVDLLRRAPQVVSPDEEVNDAMAWSIVSLDQLRVRNPFLGYGLVSGYSSSGKGTRPQYAWFFDEPTLSSWAFHRAGLSSHVREAFRFLQRFQRADGKTVHEVPQSLPYQPEFLTTSRYAYIHTDGPVYFLAAYGHYYRSTGDLLFIQEEWPRIAKTLNWCLSVVDDNDGLMCVEPEDWGSAESTFVVWKDTQLEGMWVRALREVENLAKAVGESALAARCASLAEKASGSIEKKLWHEKASTYVWGLDREGRPLESLVPHQAIGIWMGSFRSDRAERVLQRMASADFRSDWGVRSLSLSDPNYAPSAYQAGSVWPVWNAGVIIGDYRHHRPVEAFRNWLAMIRLRTLGALGPMPEVLHGRYYKRLENGAPHQMFSEVAIQNGFYDGLLGLEIDVPAAVVKLAPHLPPIWPRLEVNRIPLGKSVLDIRIEKDKTSYELSTDWRFPGKATVLLEPALPPGSGIREVTLDGKSCPFEIRRTPASTIVCTRIVQSQGKHLLRISYSGGIDFFPVDSPLRPGYASCNLRIIRAVFADSAWEMVLEGLPERNYMVDFFTGDKPCTVNGGDVLEASANRIRVSFRPPEDAKPMASGFVRWKAKVCWGFAGNSPSPETGGRSR